MQSINLVKKIADIKSAIVAIGYRPNPDQIKIIGSGFFYGDKGKIITAAHLIYQTPDNFRDKLMAMVLVNQKEGLDYYNWISITLKKDDINNDIAVFQATNYEQAIYFKSPEIKLGDSDKVEVGEDAYFIGFPYAVQLINDGFGITLIANKAMVSNVKQDGNQHHRTFLILDAISNPGNSGCPLVNSETNEIIGVMSISFRMKSQNQNFKDLDVKEPMHICAARPINFAKKLLD